MQRLGLQRNSQLLAAQGVERKQIAALLVDARKAIALGGCTRHGAVTACSEAGAVGAVVARLANDDRILARLEDARSAGVVCERRNQL